MAVKIYWSRLFVCPKFGGFLKLEVWPGGGGDTGSNVLVGEGAVLVGAMVEIV